MDYQRPDNQQPRVEDDFVRPLSPMKSVSRRRLPAALPFAIAGILVVSSVAFGATVIRSLVPPSSSATPIVVGDEPTATPDATATVEVTATPTPTEVPPPTIGQLSLTVQVIPGVAQLTWSAYSGEGFAYYKVVRGGGGAEATWPLTDGDTLIAAIDNIGTLTFNDNVGNGAFTYRVFAVTSADTGYEVLAASPGVAATVVAPTPTPTPKPATPKPPTCTISLSATLVAPTASVGGVQPATTTSGYKVKLTWTKYNCEGFQYYGIVRGNGTGTPPITIGSTPGWYSDNVNTLTMTDDGHQGLGGLAYGQTYTYRVFAYNDYAASVGDVAPACYITNILAISNNASVTIPVAPTPIPTPVPTDTPAV